MHTYRKVSAPLDQAEHKAWYEVGYYVRDAMSVGSVSIDESKFVVLSTHDRLRHAIQRVNALNGGTGTCNLSLGDDLA